MAINIQSSRTKRGTLHHRPLLPQQVQAWTSSFSVGLFWITANLKMSIHNGKSLAPVVGVVTSRVDDADLIRSSDLEGGSRIRTNDDDRIWHDMTRPD